MVRDEGSRDARLVLVGEAPGAPEMQYGRPFVGASGSLLAKWWTAVGLTRDQFYITNVLDYDPTTRYRGTYTRPAITFVPRDEMEAAFAALHERIARLTDPWLIVIAGMPPVHHGARDFGLYALTGKGRVPWHLRDGHHLRPGIGSYRGSILEYVATDGRRIKTIPTLHPAACFREAELEKQCRIDWRRVAYDATFREMRLPERTHRINPTVGEVLDYAAAVRWDPTAPLAIDIETPRHVTYGSTSKTSETKCVCKHAKTKHIPVLLIGCGDNFKNDTICKTKKCACLEFRGAAGKTRTTRQVGEAYVGCVGFALSAHESLTIPMTADYWHNPEDLVVVHDAVRAICASPNEKVLQNGLFDTYWLADTGFPVRNFRWDTRAMHQTLEPLDPHDLAYIASVYTRQPYWKDEAKDPDEIAKYASNNEALWTYNGIDVCVTWELGKTLRTQLEQTGRLRFYNEHYGDLLEPLLAISLHGIRQSESRRISAAGTLSTELATLRTSITEMAQMDLYAEKSISTLRLKWLLYGPTAVNEKQAAGFAAKNAPTFRFPKQYTKNVRGLKVISTNEVTIRRLMQLFPEKFTVLGSMLLDHRRKMALAGFVAEGVAGPDGRVRCLYEPFATTGRLKSHETPRGEGRNLQNIDRELRGMWVPDERNDDGRPLCVDD